MIRTACLAATLAVSVALPIQHAAASVTVAGSNRVSEVVAALRGASHFAPGSFSFAIVRTGSLQTLFTGIEGVRAFNGANLLNNWVDSYSNSVFNGGTYHFTNGVIGSYFGENALNPPPAPSTPAPSIFDGGNYHFTSSVIGSYFPAANGSTASTEAVQIALAEPLIEPQANAPVPEPASWAMMIGGFALAGAALRGRRAKLRPA